MRSEKTLTRSEDFDEDYFLRGKESGKSLYDNYRWLPELTVPMCQRMAEYCGISKGETVLDFGCARGYSVRALRGLGYDAWGVDISRWAIENCDPEIKPFVNLIKGAGSITLPHRRFDWIIAKDVLEHCEYVYDLVKMLSEITVKGMFVVVPLSRFRNGRYVVEEYEKDVTHCQRLTLADWVDMFLHPSWSVEASYCVPGIKDNYRQYSRGNGFILAKRLDH